jgi:peptidoglycan/xylan/chitin deacetylase (PgdA/CDA1 family)
LRAKTQAQRPFGSLTVDLDNKWAYMRMHGHRGWECFPSYLDTVVPRLLAFFRQWDLSITFFVVGQDAALPENREALGSIAAAGHEIGNHSFCHEPWLYLRSEQRIHSDVRQAEEHIQEVTGYKPVGFRAPGYQISQSMLRVLVRRGYLYDASLYPTFVGPLARAYFLKTTQLTPEQKRERKSAFGALGDGMRPIKPHLWRTNVDGSVERLLEMPVTTMPVLKTPIHLTYILYLSRLSSSLALMYFRMALLLCRLTGTPPSLILHAVDFLGCDDHEDMAFFPAMDIPLERKLQIVSDVVRLLSDRFTLLTLRQCAYIQAARAPNLVAESAKLTME